MSDLELYCIQQPFSRRKQNRSGRWCIRMTRYFLLFAVQELMLRWSGISSPIWKGVFTIAAVRPSYIWLGEASSNIIKITDSCFHCFWFPSGKAGPLWQHEVQRPQIACYLFFAGAHRLLLSIFNQKCTFLIWDWSQILLASCPKSTIPKGCWDPSFCTTSYLPVFSHAGEAARKLCPATTSRQKIVAVPSC